jgi:hypothetical protein
MTDKMNSSNNDRIKIFEECFKRYLNLINANKVACEVVQKWVTKENAKNRVELSEK